MALAVSGCAAPENVCHVNKQFIGIDIQGKAPVPDFETPAGGLVLEWLNLAGEGVLAEFVQLCTNEAAVLIVEPPKLFFDAGVREEIPGHGGVDHKLRIRHV
jgi:hypothetical protein